MVINLDLAQLAELTNISTAEALWRILFWYGGALPLAIVFIWGVLQLWLYDRQGKFAAKQKYILLALDIPQNNAQSPRAVENMFAYLNGAQKSINLMEKWWEGAYQLSFSFEIVSIEGYIQFLIRTPESFRAFIETAIYTQYPDAEISQVEDYIIGTPDYFPNPEYDLWGSEFILTANPAFPIKLYEEFEHKMGEPETHYRDPMGALMDVMSSLKRDEQLWYQIIIKPTGFDWVKKFKKEISKILGEIKPPVSLVATIGGYTSDIISHGVFMQKPAEVKKADEPLKMMNLKPEQKNQIEGIQRRINHAGLEVKMRMVYLSKKEVMNKPKVVSGFIGYIKQFNTNDLNGLMPDTKKSATSSTNYFLAEARGERRKIKIMAHFKSRSAWLGRTPFILTSEELATIWHFPIDAVVKAPLVQRAASRRIEAPISLPESQDHPAGNFSEIFTGNQADSFLEALGGNSQPTKDQPPINLPFA